MNKQLPFELAKYHKTRTKYSWRRSGMLFTEEDFEYIYKEYIYCTNCDLCNKIFKSNLDRQLDHCHETGQIRNIICGSCNQKRKDNKMLSNNTSNHKLIYKVIDKTCKEGFIWGFFAYIDGKQKNIKSSVDKDFLVKYRDKWLKDNNYYT